MVHPRRSTSSLTGALRQAFQNWAPRYGPTTEGFQSRAWANLTAPVHLVAGGETIKDDDQVARSLLKEFDRVHLDRQSFVVAIGGGALLDAVGYAAAICHRGVRLIRVPTTVLAQNDSGVGVKNGVNAFNAKNYLGTFAPPFAVVNDRHLWSTCSARDITAGFAEAVKVSLLKDPEFFFWLEDNSQSLANKVPDPVNTLIERCARLHMDHIANGGDPFERNSARPLDFGHWSAHALERLTDHRVRHGEAVSIGIHLDCHYAARKGYLSEATAKRVSRLLLALGLPIDDPALRTRAPRPEDGSGSDWAILRGLETFREHLGGRLSITMLRDVGQPFEVHDIDKNIMAQILKTPLTVLG